MLASLEVLRAAHQKQQAAGGLLIHHRVILLAPGFSFITTHHDTQLRRD